MSSALQIDPGAIRYLKDADGERVADLASLALLRETAPIERVFSLRGDLWEALASIPCEWTPSEAVQIVWPFDVTTIRVVDPKMERASRGAEDSVAWKRWETRFVRRRTEAMVNGIVMPVTIVSIYSSFQAFDNDSEKLVIDRDAGFLRQAIAYSGDGEGFATDIWTYVSDDSESVGVGVTSDPSGALGAGVAFVRFMRFCDLLTHDRHFVTARKIARNKKKVVPWLSLAKAEPGEVHEIVLRPQYRVGEVTGQLAGRSLQRERARPRRHKVTEYTRVRNGKIQVIEEFWRGGHLAKDGPKPQYNAMPLVRWYVEQGGEK